MNTEAPGQAWFTGDIKRAVLPCPWLVLVKSFSQLKMLHPDLLVLWDVMRNDVRHEELISQHIDVALIYKEMLGLAEARAYLEREHIPREIAERVLLTEQKRVATGVKTPPPPPPAHVSVPVFSCRRKNRVHDAIVEAALKLERKSGREWALALLRDERVPEEVSARILAQGPRQLRTRRAGEASVFAGIFFAK